MWTRRGSGISLDGMARQVSLKALVVTAFAMFGAAMFAASAMAAPEISYPTFSSIAGLHLNGDATQAGTVVRLTPEPAEPDASGTVFSETQINTAGSFETEFELNMHGSNLELEGDPADGMAFVMQPLSAGAEGQPGGDLGYAGLTPSAEVEFDIWPHNAGDPPNPHIAFMEDGNAENHLAYDDELPFSLYGAPFWAWVAYDAQTHTISVYASSADQKPAAPLFTHEVNLSELLGNEYTFVGFTAATGSADAVQDVLSWQLGSELSTVVETHSTPTSATSAHPSSTSVSCNLIIATASDTCVATVTDVDVPAAITPTGQVSFSSASGGTFEGNVCNLVAIPNSPDAAGCSVQFLPPSAASLQPAITAAYGGDAHHSPSSGHTYYPSAVELGKGVEIGLTGILSESGGIVTVPVTSQSPGTTTGTLLSGPDDPDAGMASFSGLGNGTATIAKAKKPGKKKQTAKPVVFGTGSLTLSKPGKGTLTIKLNGKAKLAFKKAKGKAFKAVLEVTVKTPNGTLVKTEKLTVTIRPAKKKPKKKSGKHAK
jgi:hypothetical protein